MIVGKGVAPHRAGDGRCLAASLQQATGSVAWSSLSLCAPDGTRSQTSLGGIYDLRVTALFQRD